MPYFLQMKKGIYKAVFGIDLEILDINPEGLPFFLGLCLAKIEKQIGTVGLYRVNGDAAAVEKLR